MTAPLLLIGPPGCGKTAWAVAKARALGLPDIYIPISERDSVEIAGYCGRATAGIGGNSKETNMSGNERKAA